MAGDFEDHVWKDVVPHNILDICQAYARTIYVGERPVRLAIDLYDLAHAMAIPCPIRSLVRFPWPDGARRRWPSIVEHLYGTAGLKTAV